MNQKEINIIEKIWATLTRFIVDKNYVSDEVKTAVEAGLCDVRRSKEVIEATKNLAAHLLCQKYNYLFCENEQEQQDLLEYLERVERDLTSIFEQYGTLPILVLYTLAYYFAYDKNKQL